MDLITRRLEHQVEHDRLVVVLQAASKEALCSPVAMSHPGPADGHPCGRRIVSTTISSYHGMTQVDPSCGPDRRDGGVLSGVPAVRRYLHGNFGPVICLLRRGSFRLGAQSSSRSGADLMRPARLPDLVSFSLKHGTTLTGLTASCPWLAGRTAPGWPALLAC